MLPLYTSISMKPRFFYNKIILKYIFRTLAILIDLEIKGTLQLSQLYEKENLV